MKPALRSTVVDPETPEPDTSEGAATETGRSEMGSRTRVGPSSTRNPEEKRRAGPSCG